MTSEEQDGSARSPGCFGLSRRDRRRIYTVVPHAAPPLLTSCFQVALSFVFLPESRAKASGTAAVQSPQRRLNKRWPGTEINPTGVVWFRAPLFPSNCERDAAESHSHMYVCA